MLKSDEFYQKSYLRVAPGSIADKEPGGYFRDRSGQVTDWTLDLRLQRAWGQRQASEMDAERLARVGGLRQKLDPCP